MYLYYTDTDRTTWTAVDLSALVPALYTTVVQASIVEFATGNLGVVFIVTRPGVDHRIYKGIIERTGTIVQQEVQIATVAISETMTGIHVERYDNGRYYVVFSYEDATTPDRNLYKLTTKNWTDWAGPTVIVPAGLGAGYPIRNPATFQTDEGDVFMAFEYSDVVLGDDTESNIYTMMSTDDGDTWAAPEARTAFTGLGTSGMDPIMVQRSSGSVFLVFYESASVLTMDETTTGWLDSTAGACPLGWSTKHIKHIPATNELYIVFGRNIELGGNRLICGVVIVDITSWTITKVYRDVSTPPMNNYFAAAATAHVDDYYSIDSRGRKVAWCSSWATDDGNIFACVLDVENGTFTYYTIGTEDWDGSDTYSLPRTVTIDWEDAGISLEGRTADYHSMCLNDDGTEMWFLWGRDLFNAGAYVGYIDLTDAPDGDGFYDFTWVLTNEAGNGGYDLGVDWARFTLFSIKCLRVWDGSGTGTGYIAISAFNTQDGFNGGLAIYTKTGAEIAKWEGSTDVGEEVMPLDGCSCPPIWYDGDILFGINYRTGNHINQRGLCKINLASETFTYHRPTYQTADNYHLYYGALDTTNGRIYFNPRDGVGVVAYDIGADNWTLYNDENIPGIGFDVNHAPAAGISVDPATGTVFVGWGYVYLEDDTTGLSMFNISGDFTQVKYLNGLKNGSWAWDAHGARVQLTAGNSSSYPAPAVDADDVLWLMWDKLDLASSQFTLTWDRDFGEFNLLPDLVGKVQVKWEMKKPNSLSMAVTRGHLYDPQNTLSTYRDLLKKGRRITLKLGEIVGDTTYLENQGQFIVVDAQMSYRKGDHPRLTVRAESYSTIWKEQHLTVSALYEESNPNDILENLLSVNAALDAADYSIPASLVNEHPIEYQFVDMAIWDAIEEILDHFFYTPYDDPDAVFTIKRLDLARAVDHTYSDLTAIDSFTPDDSYSDFTNQVRVIGETHDYLNVLYSDQLIKQMTGTVGWFETVDDTTVYYTDDGTLKCKNPRLVVTQSIELQGLLMEALATGQGREYISSEDADEQYVVVSMDVPDLTAAAAAAIIALALIGYSAVKCVKCGPYILALSLATTAVVNILGAVANYAYEIWAQPYGVEKLSIEYVANDTAHQVELDVHIVLRQIDDPLADEVGICKQVADGNLAIVAAQRNRVRFGKVAHLQDEKLDKIQVNHPYNGLPMEILVVGITRTYEKGKAITDEIEGWRTA